MSSKRQRAEDAAEERESKKLKKCDLIAPSSKSSSWAWTYGALLRSDSSTAVCHLCGEMLVYEKGSNKSVTTLMAHIKGVHRVTDNSLMSSHSSPSFFKGTTLPPRRQALWKEKLATLIANCQVGQFTILHFLFLTFRPSPILCRLFRLS